MAKSAGGLIFSLGPKTQRADLSHSTASPMAAKRLPNRSIWELSFPYKPVISPISLFYTKLWLSFLKKRENTKPGFWWAIVAQLVREWKYLIRYCWCLLARFCNLDRWVNVEDDDGMWCLWNMRKPCHAAMAAKQSAQGNHRLRTEYKTCKGQYTKETQREQKCFIPFAVLTQLGWFLGGMWIMVARQRGAIERISGRAQLWVHAARKAV